MSDRGWLILTDGVSSMNMWRWTVVEHYTLNRWFDFLHSAFPHSKAYAIGSKLFTVPTAAELGLWGERRVSQELETLRESLTRLPGREVRVFVKDNEDLRREKYSAQQAAKEDKKNEAGPAATAAAPASGGKGGNNNNAGNKKEGGNKGGGGGAAPKKEEPATIGHLDIRVGVVVSAEPHPDGDTLYVEQIDVGEGAPRTIVSGIREHVTLEQFVGARVLVMCNLKAKPLRGVNSNGMIVCASKPLDDNKKLVRLLQVSSEAKPGSRVTWRGEAVDVQPDPAPISANKLTKLLKELRTSDTGDVVFGAAGWTAVAGGHPITCKEIPNGVVG